MSSSRSRLPVDARSHHVSSGLTTRRPLRRTTRLDPRPRCPLQPARRIKGAPAMFMTSSGSVGAQRRGTGNPSMRAAVRCEKALPTGSTRLAASASWVSSVLCGFVQAWRTPCVGRDRSRCRRRPSPRPSSCASETVNGRRFSSGGNGARLDTGRDCLKAGPDVRRCPQAASGPPVVKSQKSTKMDGFCVDSCDFTPQGFGERHGAALMGSVARGAAAGR
jgi:hypothetical protein